jgi:hypothetical protein
LNLTSVAKEKNRFIEWELSEEISNKIFLITLPEVSLKKINVAGFSLRPNNKCGFEIFAD